MQSVEIDYEVLAKRCSMPQEEFMEIEGMVTYPVVRKGYTGYMPRKDTKTGELTKVAYTTPDDNSFYLFKDNGAKILAVAHLDTVIQVDENWTFEKATLGPNKNKTTTLWNAQLDDRLGVYIILDVLPTLLGEGCYDILLTTDEESSKSTAEHFVLPEGKEYNWIFQFDRRGTGAVLYGYHDREWKETVNEFLPVQHGTYSDICKLYWMGVKGLNVGTGYHDEHHDLCYMLEHEVTNQIRRFIRFYNACADTHFPHDPNIKTEQWGNGRYGSIGGWNDEENDDWWDGRTNQSYTNFRTTGDTRFPSTNVNTSTNPTTNQVGYESPLVRGLPSTRLQRLAGRLLGSGLDDNDDDIDDDGNESGLDPLFLRDEQAGASDKAMAQHILASLNRYDKDGTYNSENLPVVSTPKDTKNFNLVPSKDWYSNDVYMWIELPAVGKLHCLYQYKAARTDMDVVNPTAVTIFVNRVTGSRACYCKNCTMPYLVEEMFWTSDCTPLCQYCIDVVPAGTILESVEPFLVQFTEDTSYEIPLTDNMIQWVKEGGGVRLGNLPARTFTGVDTRVQRCYCDLCGQAEWADKLVVFTNPQFKSGTEANVCRKCFDDYQNVTEGKEEPF